MTNLTVTLKHIASARNQPCTVCAAVFVPAEDSGSRVLSLQSPGQEPFAALLCGGCHSKWSHGTPVTVGQAVAR